MEVKKIKIHRIKMAIAMVAVMLLVACSSGGDAPEGPPTPPTDPTNPTEPTTQASELTMGLSASATPFVDAAKAAENQSGAHQQAMRRSWTPPSGYFLYGDIYDEKGNLYVNYANSDLTNKSISAFFTINNEENPYYGQLRYMSTGNKWRLSIRKVAPEDVAAGDYYVYGFIPSAAADDATIAILSGETSYTAGAKLTIKGLRTAGYDACVIIGAKEGPDADHDNGLVAGDFKFNLKTGESVKNYLYLLFDHLCSAVSIGIKIDGDYNTLRTIKLKKMTLQTATESGLMAEKADVVVDLVAKTMGFNPISGLSYGATDKDAPVYQSDDGLTLETTSKSFLSHFLPITGVTKVVINSTYDVYDKKNNLVRKDCKATNTIRLSDIIAYFPGVQRGWKYAINLTVKPTYLYVLSDPDLNNPTVSVE